MRTRPSRALPVAVAVLAAATALPLSVSAAAAAPARVTAAHAAAPHAAAPHTAADHPTYIVTVAPGLDPAEVADAYGITPLHVYRDAMNGFAARLSPEQVEELRATTSLVRSVEADGTASSLGPGI